MNISGQETSAENSFRFASLAFWPRTHRPLVSKSCRRGHLASNNPGIKSWGWGKFLSHREQRDSTEGCWCPTMSSEPTGLNQPVVSWGVQETRDILFCIHPLNVYKLIFILFYFTMKLSARCRIDGVRHAHTWLESTCRTARFRLLCI